jgi:signal transduction histidine kinase
MSFDLVALKDGPAAAPSARPRRSLDLETESFVRVLPIRWRLLSIAALNATVAVILATLIWNGANVLSRSWDDVRRVRESDKLLVLLESEASRLQNLIHRYINQPSREVLAEILGLHGEVLSTLRNRGAADPVLSGSADELRSVTERFLQGFGEVREVQTMISHTYENDVLKPAKEMAGLYAIIEGAIGRRDALLLPSLGKSREAFTTSLVAANAFYLSLASDAADEARRNIATVEQTIPVMIDLAENNLQRTALAALAQRAGSFRDGLKNLSEQFVTRANLLKTAIDDNQAAMIEVINKLSAQMTLRELQAQGSFDRTLADIYQNVALVAVIFLTVIVVIGALIARSIILPLKEIMAAMHAVVSEKYDQPIAGTHARDEIGEMARAVAVFRENAIAKRKAENELRASKERAEEALDDLREAQQNLIAAEKLAALGGLVAGVAHEVNNPIGISLTVASSFARRCDDFAKEVASGPLRRSRLDEFLEGGRDAANQLVSNLQRAGELVHSFKQVAVDRSHADRRQFDLRESTDQIVASLRPVLKKSQIALTVDVPSGILMDSYPGSYGQVLTNLFLNSVIHAFPDGRAGSIIVEARQARDGVDIFVSDDGVGMSDEIQRRALDPFFTTRRNEGGTGLGLHIIFNLVTQQLGGRLTFESRLGWGTRFRISIPLVAPGESPPTHISDNNAANSNLANNNNVAGNSAAANNGRPAWLKTTSSN